MNLKRVIVLSATGALAVGLTLGGVGTALVLDNHGATHPVAHTSTHTPSPVVPAGHTTGGGHLAPSNGGGSTPVNTTLTPDDVWNLIKPVYDHTLYSNARFEPVPGSYVFTQGRLGGQSEQYIGTDGNVFTIGIVKGSFPQEQAAVAKASTTVGGYSPNVHVYEVKGGGTYTGDFEIFADGYWVSLTSNMLTTPQAAAPAIQGVLQALPQG
ncbi:hypothetical protein [Humibacter ginsenosidimutans]|uniref:Uncharacterized protein n=1 Tax=Humibacter ginsenosidimutans TaxID=2599293 RepID=A0A5B8M2B2_9MICO|nr:hypothetical protein [Humibacter ginsenosidimutans]QDZ14908.1 hypothetical protein FPZ11_09190 [Humibacter ginsenosidimutans]